MMLALSVGAGIGLQGSIGLAHGSNAGESSSSIGLLVFPIAAMLLGLFLVISRYKKGWTLLVIGGCGPIGRVLVPKLLDRGHMVTVLDHFSLADRTFNDYQDYLKLRQIAGDFSDPDILRQALSGCDAIIHLADSKEHASGNNQGLIQMLRAAEIADVKRILRTSSIGVSNDEELASSLVTYVIDLSEARNEADIQVGEVTDLLLNALNQPDRKIAGLTVTMVGKPPRIPA